MKFSKKTLILASCMVLCITMTAFGTVAYLTDRASVANTFTVGNIEITLEETEVNEYGEVVKDHDGDPNTPPVTEEESGLTAEDFAALDPIPTEEGNKYKLIPGAKYTKDPTVTVKANSEESYVRMIVKINKIAELKEILGIAQTDPFLPQYFVEGWDNTKWISTNEIKVDETDPVRNTNIYEFRYFEPVKADANPVTLTPLFTKILIPSTFTKEDVERLADLNITVEGHAIQTMAFEANAETGATAEDVAWAAFDAQNQAANP